ncbi:hypothetical protein MHK_007170, partial [Candidatus Magnetomorum sp. HK-1]
INGLNSQPKICEMSIKSDKLGFAWLSRSNFTVDKKKPSEIKVIFEDNFFSNVLRIVLNFTNKPQSLTTSYIQVSLIGYNKLSSLDRDECIVEFIKNSEKSGKTIQIISEKPKIKILKDDKGQLIHEKIKLRTPINEIVQNIEFLLKKQKKLQLDITNHINTIKIIDEKGNAVEHVMVEIFSELKKSTDSLIQKARNKIKKLIFFLNSGHQVLTIGKAQYLLKVQLKKLQFMLTKQITKVKFHFYMIRQILKIKQIFYILML